MINQHSEHKNNNSSIQPIAEKILDEENEESGLLNNGAQDDPVEEDIDDDIERSPEIVDLNAVKANDDYDVDDMNKTNNSESGMKFNLQKIANEAIKEPKGGPAPTSTNNNITEHTTPKSNRQLKIDDFDVSSKNGF